MPQEKRDENQKISAEKINGNVNAQNINISNSEIYILPNSEFIKTKEFEEKDRESWDKEEIIISLEDLKMIREIIKKEEEIKETIPLLQDYKEIFDFLLKSQKGLFITVLYRIIREDRLSKKLFEEKIKELKELDTETIELLRTEEEEEYYGEIFIPEIYDEYKKIYNIIRSKDIIRKVLPFIKKLKETYPTNEERQEKFGRFWYSRLDNHPYAVFINSVQPKWKFEILNKFDNKEKEDVRVYAKEDRRILFVRTICKEIADEKNIKTSENQYHIGSRNAIEITFIE